VGVQHHLGLQGFSEGRRCQQRHSDSHRPLSIAFCQSILGFRDSNRPKDSNYKYKQVIILLTDGLNTQDRWYTSQTSIDTRQQKACDNIKAADITIYTVQVNTDGDPTSTMLKNCASDPGKFFLLTSSQQIVATFNQIGTALSNLRLAM